MSILIPSLTCEHISVDCETLSLRENAALLSIGAVVFNPYSLDSVAILRAGRTFSVIIDLRDQAEKYGRHIDADTIKWWMKQSDEARKQAFSDASVGFVEALTQFENWILDKVGKTARMWTHGAAEDSVWLRGAAREAGIASNIFYRNVRDTRTLFELTDTPEINIDGLAEHVALDDAIYQALRIQVAFRKLYKQ